MRSASQYCDTLLKLAVSRESDEYAATWYLEIDQLECIAREVAFEGFALAPDKIRRKKRGQATFVTGLSVAERDRPRIPKRFKRELRQTLHYSQKFGITEHLKRRGYDHDCFQNGINRIDGCIRYMQGVEREIGTRFSELWKELKAREGLRASYASMNRRQEAPVTLLIDETTFAHHGNTLLALICVVVKEVKSVRRVLAEGRCDLQAYPYTSTRKERLQTKGLHFTDLSPDAR